MRRPFALACLLGLLAFAPAAFAVARYGTAGPNHLRGGPAADTLIGRGGPDRLQGRGGDDTIDGGNGRDFVDCGPGVDTVYVNMPSERTRHCERRILVALPRPRRCRRGGTAGSETVLGTSRGDRCRGRAGNDIVEGAGGSDRLFGGAGDDQIFGRFGNLQSASHPQ